jgi:hypothetical protein
MPVTAMAVVAAGLTRERSGGRIENDHVRDHLGPTAAGRRLCTSLTGTCLPAVVRSAAANLSARGTGFGCGEETDARHIGDAG